MALTGVWTEKPLARLSYGTGWRYGSPLPLGAAIVLCYVYSMLFDRASCMMLFCGKSVYYDNFGAPCTSNPLSS